MLLLLLLSYCTQKDYVLCRDESFFHQHYDRIFCNPPDCWQCLSSLPAYPTDESYLRCLLQILRQVLLPLQVLLKNKRLQARSCHSRILRSPDRSGNGIYLQTICGLLDSAYPENGCLPAIQPQRNHCPLLFCRSSCFLHLLRKLRSLFPP